MKFDKAVDQRLFREGGTMNETTSVAELFDAMVNAYETWAEPLTARLAWGIRAMPNAIPG